MLMKSIFFTQLHTGEENLNDGFLSSPQQISFALNCHLGINAPTHCLVLFNFIFSTAIHLLNALRAWKTVTAPSPSDLCISVSAPITTGNAAQLYSSHKDAGVHQERKGRCRDLDADCLCPMTTIKLLTALLWLKHITLTCCHLTESSDFAREVMCYSKPCCIRKILTLVCSSVNKNGVRGTLQFSRLKSTTMASKTKTSTESSRRMEFSSEEMMYFSSV